MEYTVKQLGDIAGVSGRTLRYYDQIDLLKPAWTNEAAIERMARGSEPSAADLTLSRLERICGPLRS